MIYYIYAYVCSSMLSYFSMAFSKTNVSTDSVSYVKQTPAHVIPSWVPLTIYCTCSTDKCFKTNNSSNWYDIAAEMNLFERMM